MNSFSLKEAISYGFIKSKNNFWFVVQVTLLFIIIIAGLTAASLYINNNFFQRFIALQVSVAETETSLRATQGVITPAQHKEITETFWNSLKDIVQDNWLRLLITTIIFVIVFLGLFAGAVRVALHMHDTGKQSLWDLFSCFHLVPKFFIAGFFFFILISIALGIAYGIWLMLSLILSLFGFVGQAIAVILNLLAMLIALFMMLLVPYRFIFVPFALVDNYSIISAFRHSWAITPGIGNFWRILLLNIVNGLFSMVSVFRVPLLLLPIDLMYVHTYRTLEKSMTR